MWSIAFDVSGDRLGESGDQKWNYVYYREVASCSGDQTVKIWKAYKPGNPEGTDMCYVMVCWKCTCDGVLEVYM